MSKMGNFFGSMTEYLDGFAKTALFFFVILFIIRLLGKREVGEVSVFDLVILLMIADIAVNGIDENDVPVMFYIVCLFTLLLLQKLLAFLVMQFPFLRKLFDGKPSVIIYDGKINIKEMRKQNYTIDDLISMTRNQGAMSLSEIRFAILESSGELSVFLKNNIQKEYLPVIISGSIVKENLDFLKLTEEEIQQYLKTKELDLKEIQYLSSDGKNYFTIHEYENS